MLGVELEGLFVGLFGLLQLSLSVKGQPLLLEQLRGVHEPAEF